MAHPGTFTEPALIRTGDIAAGHGDPPWSETLLEDGRNLAELLCMGPGQGADAQVQPDYNQWWIVLKGEPVWQIGDYRPITSRKGDFVSCPVGLPHAVRSAGAEPTLSLAVRKLGAGPPAMAEQGHGDVPLPDDAEPPNLLHTGLADLMAQCGEPPWKRILIDDERNKAHLICHSPGETNRAHWHYDFDEWWAVLKGELTWQMGKRAAITARGGDIVFSPRGFRHHITTVGSESSLRLAITPPDNPHVYEDEDGSAPPPRE